MHSSQNLTDLGSATHQIIAGSTPASMISIGEKMRKWPSIEGLQNVVKDFERKVEERDVQFKAKIKLDGTNAGVRKTPSGVSFQSKSIPITPEKDNAGFARWAQNVPFSLVKNDYEESLPIMTIFGEWAGKGIESGCSVKEVGMKTFFPFAIEYGSEAIDEETGKYKESFLEVEPERIQKILEPVKDFVKVLPWFSDEVFHITFPKVEKAIVDKINEIVYDIEKEDPYIKTVFGISGVGEGLVFYPIGETHIEKWGELAFKVKGFKHMVNKQQKPAQVKIEVFSSVSEFVSSFVTEARCKQALANVCGSSPPEKKNISAFLTWVNTDVKKESVDELEVLNLSWDKVSGEVTKTARAWFLSKF